MLFVGAGIGNQKKGKKMDKTRGQRRGEELWEGWEGLQLGRKVWRQITCRKYQNTKMCGIVYVYSTYEQLGGFLKRYGWYIVKSRDVPDLNFLNPIGIGCGRISASVPGRNRKWIV